MNTTLKRIFAIGLAAGLFLPKGAFAETREWVDPLEPNHPVKLYLHNGQTVSGTLRSWEHNQVVLATASGLVEVDADDLDKASYVLGDDQALQNAPAKEESVPAMLHSMKGNAWGGGSSSNVNESSRNDWQLRLAGARGRQILTFIAAAGAVAGGVLVSADGENQRNNAQFVRKGDYYTNEDDVNAGNTKVMYGYILLAVGGSLTALGFLQNSGIHRLEEEGRQRGFAMGIENHDACTCVVMNYHF